MIYSVLSISAIWQSDQSYIYIHYFSHIIIFFWSSWFLFFYIIFYNILSQVIGYSSLYYTAGPHCLSILNVMVQQWILKYYCSKYIYKICHFNQVCKSVALIILTILCNSHHYLIPKLSQHSRQKLFLLSNNSLFHLLWIWL